MRKKWKIKTTTPINNSNKQAKWCVHAHTPYDISFQNQLMLDNMNQYIGALKWNYYNFTK